MTAADGVEPVGGVKPALPEVPAAPDGARVEGDPEPTDSTSGAAEPAPAARRNPIWLRVLAGLRSLVLTAMSILGSLCLLVFMAALIFGVRPVVVVSGSMEPGLPVGSVALIRAIAYEEVKVGDVVTVARPRGLGLVTHRVVEKTTTESGRALVLKGDANKNVDPQPYTPATVSRMVAHVPGLGFVTLFLQSQRGIVAAGGILLALIAIYLLDPRKLAK